MGRLLRNRHEHYHSGIHPDSTCYWCLCNRRRITQGIYGETLEKLILPIVPSNDMGMAILPKAIVPVLSD